MQPANTLYAKVLVKKQPYSQDPVSLVICANMFQPFNKNKALYYTELPLQVTTLDQIYAKIAVFQNRANAASVSTQIQPKVFEHILDVA
mgnify:CR=1 FL=1